MWIGILLWLINVDFMLEIRNGKRSSFATFMFVFCRKDNFVGSGPYSSSACLRVLVWARRESDCRYHLNWGCWRRGYDPSESSGSSFFILRKRIWSGIVIEPCLREDKVRDWIRRGELFRTCLWACWISAKGDFIGIECTSTRPKQHKSLCCNLLSKTRQLSQMAKVGELHIVRQQTLGSVAMKVSELFKISCDRGMLSCASNFGYTECEVCEM